MQGSVSAAARKEWKTLSRDLPSGVNPGSSLCQGGRSHPVDIDNPRRDLPLLQPTRNSRLQKCQGEEAIKADDTNKRIMERVLENYSAPVSVTGNGPDNQAAGVYFS